MIARIHHKKLRVKRKKRGEPEERPVIPLYLPVREIDPEDIYHELDVSAILLELELNQVR